jgi:hypothetical protein
LFTGALDLADFQHPSPFCRPTKLSQQLSSLLYRQVLISAASPTCGFQYRFAFLQVLSLEPSDRGRLPSNRGSHLIGIESQRGSQQQALNSPELGFTLGLLEVLCQLIGSPLGKRLGRSYSLLYCLSYLLGEGLY